MQKLLITSPFILLVCTAVLLTGCARQDSRSMKDRIDERVYGLVDEKWQEDFGPRTNYRVDSAEPSPNDISTERLLPAGTVLALPETLAIATDHNHIYQFEKENLYVMALELRLARHRFEPMLFGAASLRYVKDGADEAIVTEAGLGVEKLLSTGTVIGVNLARSWIDVLTGNAQGGLAHILTVTLTQPLLRGSDPHIVLENLTQAERNLLYQVRSFNRFRKEFVVSTIAQYYQVLQARDAAQNARDHYDALVDVTSRAEKLAAAGRLPQFELEQAYQDKLIALDAYIQADKIHKQALDDFKLGLALPTEMDCVLDYNELAALRDMAMPMPEFSETEAIETALVNRFDLANAFDMVGDAERKVIVALDAERPGLDLVAATQQRSRVTSDPLTLGRTKDTGFVGLQFDPNLDTIAQENNYRFALIILDQFRRFYEQKYDSVVLDIREAYRDLAEAAQRYKVQSEQLVLAKKRSDSTMALLGYARANTRDVLDARKDLLRAQDAATEALVNYTVAMLRFYRDVEILQVRPDGMWQLYSKSDP